MEDALRRTLVAGFVVAVALAVPAGAAAWTPEDCADWYATHGSNHPDCQDYVPPAPPVETPPVVTPPPVVEAPPVETPPVAPTPIVDVPPVVDTPVDTPDVVPGVTPKVEHKAPNEVRGKEQQKPPAPLQRPVVDTGATLPFSGLPLGWVALLGAVLLAGGAACRRRVA